MATGYVLYNPLAGNGTHIPNIKLLEPVMPDPLELRDMTRITSYSAFLGGLADEDCIIIAGGDGTLNRFVNNTRAWRSVRRSFTIPLAAESCGL